MNNRQRRLKASFLRAYAMLMSKPLFPEPRLLAKAREALARVIERLDVAAVRQLHAAAEITGAPKRESNLRLKIRIERMKPLVKLAKSLRQFAAGAEAAMAIPHKKSNSVTVAAACDRLVKLLKPHPKLLVDAGYPRTHLAEVAAEARALARMAGASERARKQLSRETATIARLIEEGQRQVAIADAILTAHVKDAAVLGEWEGRRRVGERIGRPLERTRRKRRQGGDNATSATTPVTPVS